MPCGSPPRLWGILYGISNTAFLKRFTPTPVGNTALWFIVSGTDGGSPPRLWGIRFYPNIGLFGMIGSPPRLWGIRSARVNSTTGPAVHPHACGEYLVASTGEELVSRFTPTPVGNTPTSVQLSTPPYGSPPRLWGIHLWRRSRISSVSGSPPRLWGIRHPGRPRSRWPPVHPHACGEYDSGLGRASAAKRFTPTPVGNTRWRPAARQLGLGSPPRLWGIR